jgi:dTDP-glucose 4,6-dehydratase
MMKNILIAGGAGFIGSNFIKYVLKKYSDCKIVNVDLLTYCGNLDNVKDVENNSNYTFIRGDIRDRQKMADIFLQYNIEVVINFAAESHVDRSIINPEVFMTTNIIGTQVLLDTAKNNWKLKSDDNCCRQYKRGVKYVQISTDEVYGSLGKTGRFSEDTPLCPTNPYSASKAGADLIVKAYFKTFGLPAIITRSSNNYGPHQFPEKLIPLMILNCLLDKELPVYGDGQQIRDWLHVEDHCSAIDLILEKGIPGEIYNIGSNNEKTNIEIVRFIINELGKPEKLITHVQDRPSHDRRYAIDNSKITNELDWLPCYSFEYGLKETINWYSQNSEWSNNIISGDFAVNI